MGRTITTTVAIATALWCACASSAANDSTLAKSIDLGEFGDYFKLVSADRRVNNVTLMLEAKKDVDTSQLFLKAGFFDAHDVLQKASPVTFQAAFPLKKGESIPVRFTIDGDVVWSRIAIRKVDKPVP